MIAKGSLFLLLLVWTAAQDQRAFDSSLRIPASHFFFCCGIGNSPDDGLFATTTLLPIYMQDVMQFFWIELILAILVLMLAWFIKELPEHNEIDS